MGKALGSKGQGAKQLDSRHGMQEWQDSGAKC